MLRPIAVALILAGLAAAQQPAPESVKTSETERLIQTAKLWITVKYFHPYLAYKPLDWDKALIDALPKIRAARNSGEYAAALQLMLGGLQDPETRIGEDRQTVTDPSVGQRIWIHHGFPPESVSPAELFYSAFVNRTAAKTVQSVTVPLGDGLNAIVRLSEAIQSSNPYPAAKPDAYPDARYPSTEYRILAAYKIWGVIHYFFAYRDLMDEDWDDVFASFLPRFIAAKDAREYNLTIADMLTHTLDSHVAATSDELSDYFGRAAVGLRLRLIEKRPVITEILDEQAKTAGLRVGDIVSSVDGDKIADRFNRAQDYISGSTVQRRGYDSLQRVLSGVEGSTATLLVGTQDGHTKEVKLQRTSAFLNGLQQPDRKGDVIRELPGKIGYVDLTRLQDDQVPGIFEKLQSTKAIIFDARGESPLAAQTIASRLTSANDVAGAIMTGPVALSPDVVTTRSLTSTASYFFVEKVPTSIEPKYTGKTVMLIDERTIGRAEHLGLWLEAANNTTFVGAPSAGADGETSNFLLPGGITVTFSGQDVRHGNAGKLQRLGLQPAVLAAPTVSAIRQGRDEVLEKAVDYLSGSPSGRTRAFYSSLRIH